MRPSASTSHYLHRLALYFISSALRTHPSCARPLHFPSRMESSVSNSRTRTSRSLREYYSALHSRFFCRITPYRDAPLHLRVKMSIRSCFLAGSFLHKFSVSLRRDLLFFFLYRATSITKVEGGNTVTVFMCIRRIRCVSRDGIANGDAM